MLADKKTPSPNTQAIPAAQWMKDIAPISVWVIGWMDQIRLGPKGMSMCPRSCLLEYVWLGTGHQLHSVWVYKRQREISTSLFLGSVSY